MSLGVKGLSSVEIRGSASYEGKRDVMRITKRDCYLDTKVKGKGKARPRTGHEGP
jgi:hypothetical protein